MQMSLRSTEEVARRVANEKIKQVRQLAVWLTLFVAWMHGSARAQSDAPSSDGAKGGVTQISVWPKLAPGETTDSPGALGDPSGDVARIKDVTAAQLFVYPLANAKASPAVLVCPGGGYGILASDLEGSEIAKWLNKLGYVAAVLYYRVPNKRDGALQDGQRALSLLRSRAKEYGIDPTSLGVMGFSAGGHLSARLAVNGSTRSYVPIDEVDRQNCRPDFAMLIYPAYLLYDSGDGLGPETRPVKGMPPLFLAQSLDDPFFTILPYAQALTRQGDDVHCCVYDKGGHGYGLRLKSDVPAAKWSTDAAEWLEKNFPSETPAK